MTQNAIRPIVIGLFRYNGSLLVFEGYDGVRQQTFYRPLGGGIEFGEPSAQALHREIREEIGAEITNLRYLLTLENIFISNGRGGHEIVVVYEAEFVDQALYNQPRLTGYEDDGTPFQILWKPVSDFESGQSPLYPAGLLEVLAS